jgi:hypothetical protein
LKYEFSAFKLVTLIYTRPIRSIGHTDQTGLRSQVRQVSTGKVHTLDFSHGHAHGVKGGEGHDKHKGKKSKVTFNELMVKYVKMRDEKLLLDQAV